MTFAVTVLGSGAAVPMLFRNPSAHIVNVHERLYLLDCAEGTQIQLRRNGIKMQRIKFIFITHLHGDHYFGLIGLITTFHLLGRIAELHIYAVPKLKEIINIHLEASRTILRYPLIFHEIDPDIQEIICEDEAVTIETIALKHDFPTCGFLIREKPSRRNIRKDFLEGKKLTNSELQGIKRGLDYIDADGNIFKNEEITIPPPVPRSYAYVTDTAFHEPIIPIIKNVTLLYHEATFMQDKAKDAREKFHSTALEAATIAKKAGVGKLMLGHYSARYKYLSDMQEEAQNVFPNTIMADDGKVVLID